MRYSYRLIWPVLFALVLLAGCSIVSPRPGDPAYAPARPPVPPPRAQSTGAIYQAGYEMSLFEDLKARRVGDMLTIVLVEETDAKKSATTTAARDSKLEIPNPTVFGGNVIIEGRNVLQNNLSANSTFDGQGDSVQNNKLDGNITVSVVEVLGNGNLVVQGEKWITINQGDEYIRLRGIVRPTDIRPDNTVLSTQVGNAQIAYGGTGTVADANRPGWLTRFFNSIIWPL